MNVYYRPYRLHQKRKLNRLDASSRKSGVHLKVKTRFTEHFADYFPHESLADLPVELFLEKFKYQDNEYEQKVFHFLLHEEKIRSVKPRPFKNHTKYKLQAHDDFGFKKFKSVRLDANGLFNRDSLKIFVAELSENVEYIEDPMRDTDWSGFDIPFARDFIAGEPYAYLVHKPNCRFLRPTEKKVIFSSYMGSDLGRFHAWCELMEKGDLSLEHGIHTPDLFEEQKLTDFSDSDQILELYNDLSSSEGWKQLCSI